LGLLIVIQVTWQHCHRLLRCINFGC